MLQHASPHTSGSALDPYGFQGTRYAWWNFCHFVGSCLATNVFIGNLPTMGRGGTSSEVNYQQISYITVIGVHSPLCVCHSGITLPTTPHFCFT